MDLPSKIMYDSCKDEIWKELGPLDPDWFDTLTAQTFPYEGSLSDQDDLCANQEGNFKTPFNKAAADSQLFSTPKVFRRAAAVSPETENEQSTAAEPEKETLSREATQSPYFIQLSKEGVTYGDVQHHSQDSLDLLRTPQQSPNSRAKHISESLGAQILPDMSWTSSLNTPPPIQSTLILPKPDESPCPLSVSADKNVFFVRKLFPSLSNASRAGVVSPKNNDSPTIHQGVGSPVAGQNPEFLDSPQSSLNHAECVRRQKTDATEDGEIRSTVASVLDGAEDVLSIFFTNRSSALRKVKTDRIKRKLVIPVEDQSCSSKDISTTNNTAHQEPGTLPSPSSVNTGDIGITQWSPLSLSEIPPSAADASYHGNCSAEQVVKNSLTEQLQNDFDCRQGVRPIMTPTHSGFAKKKRKFVYNVETSKQDKGEDAHKMDSSSGILDSCNTFLMNGQDLNHLEKTSAEAQCCSILGNELKQHRSLTEEHLPSVQAKVLDLDMSQLSRVFAQDFSQMPDPDEVAKKTLQNDFSPSTCLSAMKRARQANLQNVHALSGRSISATDQKNLISECTISDSGFQSAVADLTHVTASLYVLPSSEFDCGSQQWPGFKSEIDRTTTTSTTSLTSTNSKNGKAHLDGILQEVESDVKLPSVIKDNQTLGPGRECDFYKESTSTQLPSRAKATVSNINGIPSKGQGDSSLLERTNETPPSVHASGFKTASNKGIHITASNLERAKRLFEETEGENTFTAQPGISSHGTKIELRKSHGSVKLKSQPLSTSDKIVENSCQLTASQKADVTELCTLLEEAESQFEFTQFKTAQPKHHCQDNTTSSQTVDKDLDPDLAGIDFDDSFNSDPGKHQPIAVMNDKMAAVAGLKTDIETSNIGESCGLSMWSKMKAEHSSTEEASSSSKHIFDGSRDMMSAQTKNLDRTGHIQSNNLENKSSMVLGVEFKTAKGNILRVSKKCLSKARALFADMGEDLSTSAKSPNKQSSERDGETPHACTEDNHTGYFLHHKKDTRKLTCSDTRDEDATKSFNDCKRNATDCQSGFLMASGKRISISAKAMQEAGALFKDCDPMGSDTVLSVRHKKSLDSLSGSVNHKQNPLKSENVEGMKLNLSEGPGSKFDIMNARPAMHHADSHGIPCLTTKPFLPLSPTTSRNICTTAIIDLAISDGADAVIKADFLMKDIYTPEDTNKQLKQKGNEFRTGHLKNSGFQTASGKGVTISSAALKKAKFLLREFNDVENEVCVKPTTSKIPAPGLPQRNHGFLAASNKPVFSREASQKGKALLSDSSFSAEVAAISHTRNCDGKKDNVGNKEKICCGFSTAPEAKVLVPQKCLLKSKNLSKEFDDGKPMLEDDSFFNDSDVMEVNEDMSMKQVTSIGPESGSDKKCLSKYQDPVVTSISEANGHTELKSVKLGPIINSENILQSEDVEILSGTPKNTVNSSRAASSMAKTSRLCVMSKNADSSSINVFSNCSGFSTASGKKVLVSEEAINKAKSLLNENATFEEANQQLKQKVDALTPQNSGFQTASGKGVNISSAALKKAKFLLSEFNEVENEICVKPTTSKIPAPGLPQRNHGFLAASDKPVFSREASQKGKALLSDSSFSAEVAAVSHTRNCDGKKDNVGNKEKICCGFSTASGAKVLVPQKCLLKSKNLSKEFDDGKPMLEDDSFFNDSDVMEVNEDMSMKQVTSIGPESGSDKKCLSKYQDPVVTSISEANGHTELKGVNLRQIINSENILQSEDVEVLNGTPKNTVDSSRAASSMAKTSRLCVMSKNADSSSINDLSNCGGFSTASGKKVLVSEEAINKAKSLLNENATFEEANQQLKQKEDALTPQNGGFQTASGKGVNISSAALKKAKFLLREFNEVENEVCVKPTTSKMPAPGLPQRNHGFLAASDKPVFSREASQKGKALLSDSSFSAEVAAVSHSRNCDGKKDNVENKEKICCGFSTAQGAKVLVSPKCLLKSKNLSKEFDGGSISTMPMQEEDDSFFNDSDVMEVNEDMSMKQVTSIAPVSGSDKKCLTKYQDPVVTSISEAHGHTELKGVNLRQIINSENILQSEDVEILNGTRKNTVDSSRAASSMAKTSRLSVMSKNADSSSISDLSNCGGFSTASGKKVLVSEEAINKAKSLLNENATFEEANQQLKQKEDALTPQNGGFQTASGKGVSISSAALKKAQTLFSECEGGEYRMDVKETQFKMPVPGPSHANHGFLAASGKPVAFSSEALQKAEALFSDISSITSLYTVDSEHKDVQNKPESKHGCFTFVEKPLVTSKDLLKDFGDGKCRDSNACSTSPRDTPTSDRSVKGVKRTSNFTAARNKDITVKESRPQVVKSFSSLQVTDFEKKTKCTEREITPLAASRLHDSPGEDVSSALDSKINPRSNSKGSVVNRTEESSFLCLQSLNLSGCTETQQRFLAQEALDCTKALLEDEDDQRLLMASEGLSVHDNPTSRDGPTEEQKGTRKRLVEDADMCSQPPLKRRLLEEFDRTVDGLKGSTLHPEKSSPNGVMKDRRVFKYSVSLQPNITGPHRSGKNSSGATSHEMTPTQHSTPGDCRHSKVPTFVPPFLMGAKTENRKNMALKDNIKTPVFVPPFKKQRTIVKETSCKPQEEEDKRHHLFNRNTCTPPSEKTQSTADGPGNKSKEKSQVAMSATANNNVIHQNPPVGCRSEGSAAEGSPVMNTLSRGQDTFQHLPNIELARDMQDMRIRKKKRQTIRPLPGSLFLAKTSGVSRMPLKSAVNGKPPARCTPKQLYSHGVHQHVCDITSETAEYFRFSLQQFFKLETFMDGGGVQLADGGWLIPANNGTAGKEEFYRSLCDTPGVDPKLISEEWAYNHYRWIVWKQASMERSFPEMMGSLCLNPEQVLLQLKYRYDVEVDHSRRPALRKIMERDDTAAKTLVLCVCGVLSWGQSPKKHGFSGIKTPSSDAKVEATSAVIWLTDGWYAIKAQLDEPLTAMLHKGRVAVGGKLIIHGAQLVGSQDACSPLEAPDSLMLKICANSSRPTRWDCKMGFHRDPRPFLLPVSSLYGNGGPVGCVDIIILRSYPVLWMERKSDGGVVFRSVRAEEKEARQHNSHKQRAMEILFAKIQAEFEKEEEGNDKPHRRTRGISRQDIASLHDGKELHEAVGDDPAYLEAHLSEQQMESLRNYSRSLMEKRQAELQDRYRRALESAEDDKGSCPKRDVTPVWRLSVADSKGQPNIVYQLSVWRPPSDLQSLLKEGRRYKVYNLTTSDVKKHGGSSTVQLTGTKKTQFQELQVSQEWLSTRFQPRVSTHFIDLQSPEFQALCGEIDLTGYVISIIDEQSFSPAFYLADGELNFVKVRCFTSLAQSGLDDVVKPHVLLAISNLQLRGQSITPTPVVYAGDLSVFSSNPKEVHLQESLGQLRSLFQGQENFFGTAEAKLSDLIKSGGLSAISSPAMQTQNAASTWNRKQDTKVISHQSVRSLGSFTPVSRNPPASNCSTEKSSLKRRRALDYLSHIPSPPPLPPLSSVASPCVNKTFIPPRRSGTPSTFQTVQTPVHKPVSLPMDDEWANDEELAMIDTQALIMSAHKTECDEHLTT